MQKEITHTGNRKIVKQKYPHAVCKMYRHSGCGVPYWLIHYDSKTRMHIVAGSSRAEAWKNARMGIDLSNPNI